MRPVQQRTSGVKLDFSKTTFSQRSSSAVVYTLTNYLQHHKITEQTSKKNGKMVFRFAVSVKVTHYDHILFINISRVDESGITVASHFAKSCKVQMLFIVALILGLARVKDLN